MRLLALISLAVAALTANLSSAQTGNFPNFQHVIIVVQENRTPDNLFQGLCAPPYGSAQSCNAVPKQGQYDIQTANWLDDNTPSGTIQPLTVQLANVYDLSHAHKAFVAMCNITGPGGQCRMNGAAGITCTPAPTHTCPAQPQFRFVDNSSGIVNPYLQLAAQYGWANYMFQTNQGPSFPAHQFLFGGTSAPSAFDDAIGIYASENPGSVKAGCAAPTGSTAALINPSGLENQSLYPCYEHETLPDLLPPFVTWRYYAPGPVTQTPTVTKEVVDSIWTAPDAISHICQSTGMGGTCAGSDFTEHVDLVSADVLKDVANCNLASLTWVIPTAANSDHAAVNDGGGPSWVASVVNAIGNASTCDGNRGYWSNTAILITWDDWGGWYDHEPPTILPEPQGDYQYGFRVPFLFVSAYTPAGYINNVRHDFGSILRFVEHNFGIREGSLYFADARSHNALEAFYDLRSKPRPFQTIAAPKDANFFLNDTRPQGAPDDD
jgi:phospholipase C